MIKVLQTHALPLGDDAVQHVLSVWRILRDHIPRSILDLYDHFFEAGDGQFGLVIHRAEPPAAHG
jgi:hypothetical protein